ncbi:phosphoglycerate mutase [Amycolatopsis mediterranei S699]|uniref:Phosphoglycerate mutase n=2 Tax=Amycolatopsis mediterranei TaxID=33910 RepID=A0A0H3DJK7_AMYMU|nr:histidine phosphatase family protein [Amycolatopsis mediterranei]ADJ50382.1 phosphoglycerate mutase [Amycolatopsis mediterranei U32]AEK47383.1 phosphoglycerate mutase [Amycolatopsis mediterranei S699]AFO82088.1 phosphoglycerate mutase [Amycolatopsis mediterranei S699]AGT89217.1 phosphoglycerate mutase [Amycolatopsis mediterranei RB]KDO08232.1 phosphoglycerate mutase [Amycolatopsis mediterranei]
MLTTRYLFLTRHGEATPNGTLTEAGCRQAVLLGRRLRDVPVTSIHHGPLPRATQTAHLIADQLPGVPIHIDKAADDFVPYTPKREELPETSGDLLLAFTRQFPPADEELAAEAERRFSGPVPGTEPRYEVLVTHNFLVGWLVRASQDAPPWRWLTLTHANAGLTVIRYSPGRPAALLTYNDLSHLPAELRWTGFPPDFYVP